MNKITLIGNLTRDPELSQTPGGVSVCKFSIAVQRRFANADGEHETDFFNVIAWRKIGETAHKYLKKGNKACVVGSLQTRQYETREGEKRTAVEVVADEVEFLTPKAQEGLEVSKKPLKAKYIEELEPVDIDDGELPF